MKEEMKSMDLPEPEIVISDGDFRVIFRRKKEEIVQETTQETTQEILTEIQKSIIKLIQKNPSITQTEMAKVLKITREGIKYNMNLLKKMNIIERIGATKKGYWKLL